VSFAVNGFAFAVAVGLLSIMAIPAIMAIMAISLDHVRSRTDLSRRAVDHQITRFVGLLLSKPPIQSSHPIGSS
jgi:hypothetical protein